jgi:hypothetical protein
MAEREYEEKRQRGEISPRAFPEGVKCDLEHAPAEREKNGGLRPSEAILGAAILLPAALKVAKGVKDTVGDARKEDDPRKDPAAA